MSQCSLHRLAIITYFKVSIYTSGKKNLITINLVRSVDIDTDQDINQITISVKVPFYSLVSCEDIIRLLFNNI